MSHPYDPEVAPVIPYLPRVDVADVDGTRAGLAAAASAAPSFEPGPGVRIEARTAPGLDGAPPVDVYVVTPTAPADGPRPALVWLHGGGFVIGDAAESLPFLCRAAREAGTVGVSVQYRLAPETAFPGAFDDARAALAWVAAEAGELGVDATRIAVGGQSAGGALAAGLALHVRDTGAGRVAFQLLDIPVIDDRIDTESMRDYPDALLWHRRNAELSWAGYLAGAPATPYAAPGRATDLRGLPPAFITVNQFDPLRDEGLEYARRLAHADVPTEVHMYAGTFHGSSGVAVSAAVSQRQNSDLCAALARAVTAIAEEAHA